MSTSEAFFTSRYGAVSRVLHWGTAALIALDYGLSYVWHGPAWHAPLLMVHKSAGILVLVLTALRLIYRLMAGRPEEEPVPVWQAWMSRLAHILLYAFMVVEPALGWVGTVASGHAVNFFFLGELPAVIAQNHALGHQLIGLHKALTNIFLAVIGLHAAAALYHHFVLKDGVLRRML